MKKIVFSLLFAFIGGFIFGIKGTIEHVYAAPSPGGSCLYDTSACGTMTPWCRPQSPAILCSPCVYGCYETQTECEF